MMKSNSNLGRTAGRIRTQIPGVIPSAAVLQAERGISRASSSPFNSKQHDHPILRRALHLALLCLALFAFAGAGDPASRFNELGHQLMCICGCNQILLECNHVGCPDSDGMRNELMSDVTRGDSDSLVEQAFVQKYGPTVLAAPTTTGFDRTAWIMPFAALIFGFGLVIFVVRAWKNRPTPAIADGLRPLRGAELDQFRDQAGKETDL